MRVPHAYESVLYLSSIYEYEGYESVGYECVVCSVQEATLRAQGFLAERESFAAEGKSLRPGGKVFGAGREGGAPQVRELFAAAGLTVTYLKRTRIGGFRLPRELGVGQAAALEPTELRRTLDRGADAGTSVSG